MHHTPDHGKLQQPPVSSQAYHRPLQSLTRAGRGVEFLVSVYTFGWHPVPVHEQTHRLAQGSHLRIGRVLKIKITQDHHADVVRVVIAHMGPLVTQRSSFPESPRSINDEVIADVTCA